MRVLTALALTQGVVMLINTPPLKKVRQAVGNWVTPYPSVQTQKDIEETIATSMDLSDMILTDQIKRVENKIDALSTRIDSLLSRISKMNQEANNEESTTNSSEVMG